MPRELELCGFFDTDPINWLGNQDLGVFAVSNNAPENAGTVLPADGSSARQFGLIREAAGLSSSTRRCGGEKSAPRGMLSMSRNTASRPK